MQRCSINSNIYFRCRRKRSCVHRGNRTRCREPSSPISRQFKPERPILFHFCANTLLRIELSTDTADPKTFSFEADFRSVDWHPDHLCCDAAIHDTIGEELADTIQQYGHYQSN